MREQIDYDRLVYLVLLGGAEAVLITLSVLLVAKNGAAIVVLFVTYPIIEIAVVIGATIGLCVWLWGMNGTHDVVEKKPEYTILKKYRVKGVVGFCHKTKFKCDKGVFIASEAIDPLGVEVCIMKEKGGFETEPLRRLSTKEAIEKFVRGEWPSD